MIDLFGNASGTVGLHIPPEYNYIKRSLLKEVDVVKRYYRLNAKPFPNQHPLIRLIEMLPLAWNADDYQYSNIIEDAASGLSRTLGFTSDRFKGSIFTKGFLLGSDTKEAVLSVYNEDFFLDANQNWYKLTPINYVYHTRSDVTIPLLNNKTKGSGYGLLTINIPMLMVKYRYWYQWQKSKSDSIPSGAAFVTSFVIPDILDSYMDIAIFNRLDQQLADLPLRKYSSSHPFYLTDFTDKIDDYNRSVLRHYKSRRVDGQAVLTGFPMFFHANLGTLLESPEGLINRNNDWFYIVQRLPFYRFLLRLQEKGYINDTNFTNRLKLTLKRIKYDGGFRQTNDPQFLAYFTNMFESLVSHV